MYVDSGVMLLLAAKQGLNRLVGGLWIIPIDNAILIAATYGTNACQESQRRVTLSPEPALKSNRWLVKFTGMKKPPCGAARSLMLVVTGVISTYNKNPNFIILSGLMDTNKSKLSPVSCLYIASL
jgi:hypothetical protein